MINRSDLDDYFMKPYFVKDIGYIYPVNIFNYDRFRLLAGKYITQGINTLHNLYKVSKAVNVLDYFIGMALKMDNEMTYLASVQNITPENEEQQKKINELKQIYEQYKNGNLLIYSIKEIEELFSIVLEKEVEFYCLPSDPINNYYFGTQDRQVCINRDNFNLFREVIMWQNILFEPPTSPSKIGNDLIRQTIEVEFGKNEDTGNLASICSIVSVNTGLSDEQLKKYTYYRLMYDFSSINKQHGNIFSFMLRSQGCAEASISDLSQAIDLHKNPYDSIFRKHKHEQGKIN